VRANPSLQANSAIPLTLPRIEGTCRASHWLCVARIRPAHVPFWANDARMSWSWAITPQWTCAGTIRTAASSWAEKNLDSKAVALKSWLA